MKLNQNRINDIFRNNEFELPAIPLIASKSDIAIPFEVKTGFINATENGNTFDIRPEDFSRFERIFTGFEAVSIAWENSTSTYVDSNGKLRKAFNTGRVIPMWLSNENQEDEFNELQEATEFLTDRVVTTIRAYSKTPITSQDVLKFYNFPAKYGKTLFHIDRVSTYGDPRTNKDAYWEITFKSVNDRLANTGLAINQYVQNGAPGEGYSYPKMIDRLNSKEEYNADVINENEINPSLPNGAIIYVRDYKGYAGVTKLVKSGVNYQVVSNTYGLVLDETKIANKPIDSFQIEIFGKGVLADLYFYGRPLAAIPNARGDVINQPRVLLLNKPQQPDNTQRDASQPYARNTAYNWIKKSQLVMESWYDSWSAQRKGSVNPGSTKNYMGALEIFYGSADEVVTFNPAARAFLDLVTLGIAEFFYPTTTEFKKTQGQDGVVIDLQPDANGVFDFAQMFTNNFFKNKAVPRLPIDYQETVVWSLKQIPLIGGFLDKVTLGLNRGWRQSTDLGGRHFNVSGIIPTALLNFYQNAYMPPKKKASVLGGGDNKAYSAIPLDDLQSDSSPSSTSKVDYATILNYTLTDVFEDSPALNTKGKKYRTENFNYQDDKGFPLTVWDPQNSRAVDKDPTNPGFAVDLFGLHFVGDADVKVTFFSNGEAVYTTKLKTLSSLTKSVRDWNTTYKLSDWSSPAGVVVDTKTPYRVKASDYEVDISDATNQQLANGFKGGVSHGTFLKDEKGELLLDANGNPIPKTTDTGVEEQTNVNNLIDGAKGVASALYKAFKPSSIPEVLIPISPKRVLEVKNQNDETERTTTTTLTDILNANKYPVDDIRQFDRMIVSYSINGYDRVSTAGKIFSFGIAGDTNVTKKYKVTYNIFQTNAGYRFTIVPSEKEIFESIISDADYVKIELLDDGTINLITKDASGDDISAYVEIDSIIAFQ